MPPSAWIGSTITAAVCGVVAACTASMSSKSTWMKPGTSGSKGSR